MVDLVNELAGKVAIVTGSARNIGRATALELARAGAALVINARVSGDLCEEVAREITDAGGRALPFVADITDAAAVGRMVEAARAEFGGIDILVNNAAFRSRVPFVDLDDETWHHTLGAGFQGAYLMCKACVPDMIERGGGAIISVGGVGSYAGQTKRTHAMAAKAGLGSLTRGLAIDLGQHNIRANNVIVGHYDTEIAGSGSAKTSNVEDLSSIPLGRLGTPQDMADLIRFLVGPGGSYITAQTIHSNGGSLSPL
ncbi:MAG: SDR family oxidoreductase [Alphaproteobacteria bacterium]|nr:SDR family oxidoreductase [Alphaproteobacteria bacterium]